MLTKTRHKYIPTQLYDNSPCAWADHPDAVGDARYYCGEAPVHPVHEVDLVGESRALLNAPNAYTLRIQVRELLDALCDEVERLRELVRHMQFPRGG